MFQENAVNLFVTNLGLLGAIMSEKPVFAPKVDMRRVNEITGNQIELKVTGLPLPVNMLANDAAQIATRTRVYTQTSLGMLFNAAFGSCADDIPYTEVQKIRNPSKKMQQSFMEERLEIIRDSIPETLATQLHTNTIPSQSNFGGIRYQIDDTNTFGLIDRSDAGNTMFRSVVNSTAQVLEASVLETMRIQLLDKGNPNLIVTGETLYAKISNDFNNAQMIEWTEAKANYGSTACIYAGIPVLLDKRTASSHLYMMDTRWWKLWIDKSGEWSTGYSPDPVSEASYMAKHYFFTQLLCSKFTAQGKYSALTA